MWKENCSVKLSYERFSWRQKSGVQKGHGLQFVIKRSPSPFCCLLAQVVFVLRCNSMLLHGFMRSPKLPHLRTWRAINYLEFFPPSYFSLCNKNGKKIDKSWFVLWEIFVFNLKCVWFFYMRRVNIWFLHNWLSEMVRFFLDGWLNNTLIVGMVQVMRF